MWSQGVPQEEGGSDGSFGEGLTPRRPLALSDSLKRESAYTGLHLCCPTRLDLPSGTLLFGVPKDSIKCGVFPKTCEKRARAFLNETQTERQHAECPVCILAAAANVFQIVLLMVIFRGEFY